MAQAGGTFKGEKNHTHVHPLVPDEPKGPRTRAGVEEAERRAGEARTRSFAGQPDGVQMGAEEGTTRS